MNLLPHPDLREPTRKEGAGRPAPPARQAATPLRLVSVGAALPGTRRFAEAAALSKGPLGRETTARLLATALDAALEDRVGALPAVRPVVAAITAFLETALRRLGTERAATLGFGTALETALDDRADAGLTGLPARLGRRAIRPPAGLEAAMQELSSTGLATLGLVALFDAGAEALAHAISAGVGAGCRRLAFVQAAAGHAFGDLPAVVLAAAVLETAMKGSPSRLPAMLVASRLAGTQAVFDASVQEVSGTRAALLLGTTTGETALRQSTRLLSAVLTTVRDSLATALEQLSSQRAAAVRVASLLHAVLEGLSGPSLAGARPIVLSECRDGQAHRQQGEGQAVHPSVRSWLQLHSSILRTRSPWGFLV